MDELKAQVEKLNIFQMIEIQKLISARMLGLGAAPATSGPGVKFQKGDMVEFYSSRKACGIKAIVDRVNGKSLSCHEFDKPLQKWRVGPSMCRLVGADKLPELNEPAETTEEAPVVAPLRPPASVPTAASGIW